MIRLSGLVMAALSVPGAALAQHHADHQMPADPHAGHHMPAPAASTPVPGGTSATQQAESTGTDLKPGSAPAPAAPTDRYADRFWPADRMAASRAQLARKHGGMPVSMLALNIAEWQPARGGDRFRWDGEGWWGGDIHRLTVKSEGTGRFRDGVDEAEVQALYSRALDPYWNLQAGVRQDLQRGPKRSYVVVGVEGLAPYWFEVEAALFLSDRGDVSGRVEAYYDQRITQRLILQPRAEVAFALQDDTATRTGRGIGETSLDLRLRYEIAREFAPYIGATWERRFGRTGDLASANGGGRGGTRLALGVRAWF